MLTSEQQPAARPKSRRGGRLTRQHIVEASMHLFSARGYARTTVRDIARQAGISDAAIFYHFHTKGDVLDALIDADLDQPADAAPAPHRKPSPGLALYERLVHTTRLIEQNLELLTIILREALAENPHAVRRYRRLMDRWEQSLVRVLEESLGTERPSRESMRSLARQVAYTTAMVLQGALVLHHTGAADPDARRLLMLNSIRRGLGWLLPDCAETTGPV
ncbi:MAG: helix-turn-helix domain-containing protein [Dehalococcoidia bacterium]